jgi:hypothetical protein
MSHSANAAEYSACTPMDGLDEAGVPGVVAESPPQFRDRLGQGARGDRGVTPDLGEQLFLGDQRRGSGNEVGEYLEALRSQFDRLV